MLVIFTIYVLCNFLLISESANPTWTQEQWCEAAKKKPCDNPNESHRICAKGLKCEGKAGCVVQKLSAREKDYMLDLHNKRRNDVAMGHEPRMPQGKTAGNMMAMSWDDQIELLALCHANECIDDHDLCRAVPPNGVGAGQNLAMVTSGDQMSNNEFSAYAVNQWYNEIKDVSDPEQIFDAFDHDSKDHIIGHFTQIVWADTFLLGCVWVLEDNPSNSKYVQRVYCNYYPAGNVITLAVFKTGSGASMCPPGLFPNKKYPGLCGEIRGSGAISVHIGQSVLVLFGILYSLHLL